MNIKQLREVAQAATPGPWDYVANGAGLPRNRVGVTMKDSIGDGYSSRCVALVCAIDDFDDIEPNAAHIATFNPALIAKLLDVVEAAQVLIEHLDYRMTVSTVIDPKQYNIRGDDMRIIDGKIETARSAIKALEG